MGLYRRLLAKLAKQEVEFVYSYQLAKAAGLTAAQVRRDIMAVGYEGSPNRGYVVRELMESIGRLLDPPSPQAVALVGVGNLGRAILAYFAGRCPNLKIVAAFDNDPAKTDLVYKGCRCHGVGDMRQVFADMDITTAIVTVPAGEAQGVADRLVEAGARGILNFAPVALRVPPSVYVEHVDITTSLEKATFFARRGTAR